jgi:hypothetical protein
MFRAPMRSRSDAVDPGATVERALTRGFCGMGGVLHPPPTSIADAAAAAAAQHDERLARRIERFAAVPDGAFVWTRDVHGLFWLGRLRGPWFYDGSPEAVDVDLVHVRPCSWLDAPTADDRVPARVHVAFGRGGRNWQEIHDTAAASATAALWRG